MIMAIIGTLIIIGIYIVIMVVLASKGSDLAKRLVGSIYWFAIGFWDIISTVYLNAGDPRHYVATGLLFCVVGIIYFVVDIVKHHYEGNKTHA